MSRELKTLAIRLDADLHARLTIVARLRGEPVVDLIRQAIEDRLTALAQDPSLAEKAERLQADIDREAAEQRQALNSLFAAPSARSTRAGTASDAKRMS